jgi:hypothetical protein
MIRSFIAELAQIGAGVLKLDRLARIARQDRSPRASDDAQPGEDARKRRRNGSRCRPLFRRSHEALALRVG